MEKKTRIAQIAPLWIPVPPRTYGGIELILHNLTEELVKRGYPVTLFASGDSETRARLIPAVAKGLWLQHGLKNPHAAVLRELRCVFDRISEFDIIHNHFNFFLFPLLLKEGCPPFLTTIHRPMDDLFADAIKAYPTHTISALSEDHKKSIEDFGIKVEAVIPNGIDVERYTYNESPGEYILYLSRLNKEKGIVTALEVAKAAGKKLVVAGNVVGGEEWAQFLYEVQPKLNEEGVKFVGQVDFAEKVQLMRNAAAFLFPIDRREPFGLVMIEAMACGTPVIAFRKGSVPEVVEDGHTGFVVDTKEEMVRAIGNIGKINRAACRAAVEKNFTIEQMTARYEELYSKIV